MDWACCMRRDFAAPAASDFPSDGKETKGSPGTAPDEHFVLIVAFPRTPLRGTRTCVSIENFRRAKSEWASKFLPGHWALGLQKFPLVRFHDCAWLCRANVPGAYSGGSPKDLPYPNRKDFLETRRGEACPSRRAGIWRAGQCPAPTVNLRRLFSQGRHAGPPAFHSDGTGQTKTVQQNEVLRQSSF